jgi:hypothetical protein
MNNIQTFDIYAIETGDPEQQLNEAGFLSWAHIAFIGSTKQGYKERYREHRQEAKSGLNDRDVWLRNNPTARLILLDTASTLSEAHTKEFINILKYFKKGYCILNKKHPLTNTELPLCILHSVRLAYGQDERYARFHDYYDLGLKYTKEFTRHAANSNNIGDEMNASWALVERMYQEFNII